MAASIANILYVCSTSHLDWDWLVPFDQYYSDGVGGNVCQTCSPVRYSFDRLFELLDEGTGPPCSFDLAEIARLQRYLADNPGLLQQLPSYAGRLTFLGGGITSRTTWSATARRSSAISS